MSFPEECVSGYAAGKPESVPSLTLVQGPSGAELQHEQRREQWKTQPLSTAPLDKCLPLPGTLIPAADSAPEFIRQRIFFRIRVLLGFIS